MASFNYEWHQINVFSHAEKNNFAIEKKLKNWHHEKNYFAIEKKLTNWHHYFTVTQLTLKKKKWKYKNRNTKITIDKWDSSKISRNTRDEYTRYKTLEFENLKCNNHKLFTISYLVCKANHFRLEM